MKRKISLSFTMLGLTGILSLTNVISVAPVFVNIFRGFTLLKLGRGVCSVLSVLAPLILVVFLYLNRKQDITKMAFVVLMVLGVASLGRLILNLPAFIVNGSKYDEVVPLVKTVWLISDALLTGGMLLFAAISIKKQKTSKVLMAFGFVGLWVSTLYIVVIVLCRGDSWIAENSPIFPDAIIPFLTYIGLWALPKTLYNYENCWLMNANNMKLLGYLIATVILVLVFATALVGNESNNNSSNNSDSYRCNVCGGDGWDSENNCSCIWCGGDGKTSWNP